jgi:hypothetical protein
VLHLVRSTIKYFSRPFEETNEEQRHRVEHLRKCRGQLLSDFRVDDVRETMSKADMNMLLNDFKTI